MRWVEMLLMQALRFSSILMPTEVVEVEDWLKEMDRNALGGGQVHSCGDLRYHLHVSSE